MACGTGRGPLECGGKRSATPLWLLGAGAGSGGQRVEPKRRRRFALPAHSIRNRAPSCMLPDRNAVEGQRTTSIMHADDEHSPPRRLPAQRRDVVPRSTVVRGEAPALRQRRSAIRGHRERQTINHCPLPTAARPRTLPSWGQASPRARQAGRTYSSVGCRTARSSPRSSPPRAPSPPRRRESSRRSASCPWR